MGNLRREKMMTRKLALMSAVAALGLTFSVTANAGTEGRFVGHPSCVGDHSGTVTCSARVGGLKDQSLVFLWYQTIWACVANPNISITADNGLTGPTGPITNGRLFSVQNGARTPLFYEIILQTDFGCTGDVWTVVRYTNVTLQLFPNIDITFNVGTVNPT
jgi:hypothetical protein